MKNNNRQDKDKNKILVICGLTASGKTSLALKVAKNLGNTTIISVDSRQAYQGLPILTGQDIPKGFTRHITKSIKYEGLPGVYFTKGSISIYGQDQVPPTKTLNISSYTLYIWKVIKEETSKGRYIIIVGGTGLYLKALTQPMLDIHTGYNLKLRTKLSKLSTKELQEKLACLNKEKFKNLNHSDQQNSRRLIRAIEILSTPSLKKPSYLENQNNTLFHWVGLKPPLNSLEKNIHSRVLKRLKNKAVIEVKTLTSLQNNLSSPIFSALGLVTILKYQNKEISYTELIKLWVQADLKYAKRQLTWFKKQLSIIWYDQDSNQKELIKNLSLWLENKVK